MVDKHGTVYYDIIKTKVFVDVIQYIDYVNDTIFNLRKLIEKIDNYMRNEEIGPNGTVTVNGKEFKGSVMQSTLNNAFHYVKTTSEAVYDLYEEVNGDIMRVSLVTTGLPAALVNAIAEA